MKNNIKFNEWLVGFTEYNGSFNININNNKIIYNYKIIQKINNKQLIYKIKDELKVGEIIIKNNIIIYKLNDISKIIDVILPIYDKYPLLSNNYNNYIKFKECILISNDITLNNNNKLLKINNIINKDISNNQSPIWNNIKYNEIKSINDIKDKISKSWLTGLIETEGSFYIKRESYSNISEYGKYKHYFGISLKSDPIILYSIKYLFHIKSNIKFYNNYYILETSNYRSLNNIIKYFILNNNNNIFNSNKSFEFTLWKRTLLNNKDKYDKLYKIQQIIRLNKI
uniref:Orf2 n=1 Tax=Candida frijolesensis TaxID=434044 RepID=F8RHP0_9ASCO|nr:orf2 [Candida frijolesensis]ADK72535.1 orf2 [Candida frijolesensis]